MSDSAYYYIIAFNTTTDAMQAEKYAKDRIHAAIMPVPREISSGCGLALRILETEEQFVCHFFESFPISGTLYRMSTKRINGRHPIEKLR